MCNGSIMDKLISFSLPLMVSGILQLAFNAVDIIVVGRFSGSQALAAVGSTTALINVFTNLFIGISLGANVLAARFYAAGKDREMSETVHTSITLALISGIMMAVIGVLLAKWALEIMGTPDDVIGQSALYMRIYFMGMPFFMLYDFGASILRSIGDTRRPMYALIVSGVVNVILNLLFVVIFRMGVAGAGLATVGANAVSAAQIIYFLMHEELPIRLSFQSLMIDRDAVSKILRIGVPAGLQGMVFSLANVCIQSGINSFGSAGIAGSAVELNYEYFAYYLVNAFAQTVVTFTGQNYGAKNEERCKKIFRLGMMCSVISCGVLSTIFVVFRTFFIGLFTSDPAVYRYAVIRFLFVLMFECLTSSYEISGGCLRGFGRSMTPAILTVFGSCVLRLVWLATVCHWFHDYRLLMVIYPISWMLTGSMVLVAYFRTRKKLFV